MRKILLPVILLLTASMFSSVYASSGGLKGTVINTQDAQPIEGAVVKLTDPVDKSTLTNRDGRFEFSNLDAGIYNLEISATGFEPSTYEGIHVIDGLVTDLGRLAMWPSYMLSFFEHDDLGLSMNAFAMNQLAEPEKIHRQSILQI